MPLKIRLARRGTKKRPYYHIVVAEAEAPRDGRFIEKIGHINPLLPKDNPERQKIDEERAKHWLKSGAQPTDRVLRVLDKAGIKKREERKNPEKALPGKKRLEREAAAAEAATKAAAEAARPPRPSPRSEIADAGGAGHGRRTARCALSRVIRWRRLVAPGRTCHPAWQGRRNRALYRRVQWLRSFGRQRTARSRHRCSRRCGHTDRDRPQGRPGRFDGLFQGQDRMACPRDDVSRSTWPATKGR